MAPQVTVLSGGAAPVSAPRTQLWTAYEHYRLGRQGDLVSEKTLETYVTHVEPFLTWLGDECGVRRFADLDIGTQRYAAAAATSSGTPIRLIGPTRPHSGRRPSSDGPCPDYPLTAPATASMMWRCASTNTSTIGASVMIEPAQSAVQLVEVWLTNA
jgi:hypothetical protein